MVLKNLDRKPRVLFPLVEAGMGHIMPMESIIAAFKKKYGNEVEVLETHFFQDSGSPDMKDLEELFTANVRWTNRHPRLGRIASAALLNPIVGKRFPCWITCRVLGRRSYRAALDYIDSFNADIVFSTHFSTQYYIWKLRKEKKSNRPISVTYCTDANLHNYFRYPADYTLVYNERTYKKHNRKLQYRTKESQIPKLSLVPFFIRQEAFNITADKAKLREELGLPQDKFTILLAEGGYGIGKMQKVCELLLEKDLPITIIAVCGKNEKLFEHLKNLTPKHPSVTFVPIGFNSNMLKTVAASDLFIGKSGASSIAEPTFFGVPSIISGCATGVETQLAKHFCHTVGSALKVTNPNKIVQMVEEFVREPQLLVPYASAAVADKKNYGAETAADFIYNLITSQALGTEGSDKSEMKGSN